MVLCCHPHVCCAKQRPAGSCPVLGQCSVAGLCVSIEKPCLSYCPVCLRTKTRPPTLLRLGCVWEQGAGSPAACRETPRALCNLSLILAVGYGWKLKLSANIFCISTFLKYFTCCVHIYLSPFPSLLLFFPLQLLI